MRQQTRSTVQVVQLRRVSIQHRRNLSLETEGILSMKPTPRSLLRPRLPWPRSTCIFSHCARRPLVTGVIGEPREIDVAERRQVECPFFCDGRHFFESVDCQRAHWSNVGPILDCQRISQWMRGIHHSLVECLAWCLRHNRLLVVSNW